MSAGDDRDRLGGRSDAQAEGRGDTAGPPRGRFADDDRGENPAAHFPDADPDVARRLAGADTGSLRAPSDADPNSAGRDHPVPRRRGSDDPSQPPVYEGATSASALSGQDSGMGSAGVSAGAGSPAGSPATGTASGRSGSAPGVSSTTGQGYSHLTGTGRTSGPAPGGGSDDRDRTQPPRSVPGPGAGGGQSR